MANEGYHEEVSDLSDATRDMHRAITSLMEELEAIDWYNQRVDACKDPELKAVLAHNRDEEKEHAAMVLEWIRRQDETFSKELKDIHRPRLGAQDIAVLFAEQEIHAQID
jgi:ferritin-like protein